MPAAEETMPVAVPGSAGDVPSALFQSNMQSIAYVLALRREILLLQDKHAAEMTTRDTRISCLTDIIQDQQERLEHLKSAVSLKDVWARLLSYQAVDSATLQGWDEIPKEKGLNAEESHAAAAMTVLSAAIAREMSRRDDQTLSLGDLESSTLERILQAIQQMQPAADSVM